MKKNKKSQKIQFEIKTRINLDHLTFGWMCPICEKIWYHCACKGTRASPMTESGREK